MQVFIIGTPLETAMALDNHRLNKQIIECQQILDALNGAKAWSNHPCVLQYRGHEKWLEHYLSCLTLYKHNATIHAKVCSDLAQMCEPEWHTTEYFDQMKRRLYSKNPEHYKQWAHLGTSDENWYFVDKEWRKYINGKRIE
jgi:hypothetical protein